MRFILEHAHRSLRIFRRAICSILVLIWVPRFANAQLAPGSLDVHWNEGAVNCAANPQPPLQVHAYNPQTFILRENLCSTFEAPFMYLLIGRARALLIDTGDVSDPGKMPLANTVMQLLPANNSTKLPLLVVHTHRHLDHRSGDGQFANLPNVQVVRYDLESVRRFYQFTSRPDGVSQIDLGGRILDVLPTPGHSETEISFYDRSTGLLFAGDFLMPGRLLIEDAKADLASARRMAAFFRDLPVSYVLGGHIEINSRGETFPWGSQYHPDEHVLQMSKDDLLALPAAISRFNGFYTVSGQFILLNSIHILILFAIIGAAILFVLIWLVVRYIRRRRKHSRDVRAAGSAALGAN